MDGTAVEDAKAMDEGEAIGSTVQALSLTGEWPARIRDGEKTIETRSWYTPHRGPLLICAAKTCPAPYGGQAVAIAWLADCRRMTQDDEAQACCEVYDGAYAWVLSDVQAIDPFPVHGRQRLFPVTYSPPQAWIDAVRKGAGSSDAAGDPDTVLAIKWLLAEECKADFYTGWWLYLRDRNDGTRNDDGDWGWQRDEWGLQEVEKLLRSVGEDCPKAERYSQALAEWFGRIHAGGLRVLVDSTYGRLRGLAPQEMTMGKKAKAAKANLGNAVDADAERIIGWWDPARPWPVGTEVHNGPQAKPDVLVGVGPGGATLRVRHSSGSEVTFTAANWNHTQAATVTELVRPSADGKPTEAAGREGPDRLLVWGETEPDREWEAASQIQAVRDEPFHWRVRKRGVRYTVATSSAELISCRLPTGIGELADAQQWCQDRETVMVAELKAADAREEKDAGTPGRGDAESGGVAACEEDQAGPCDSPRPPRLPAGRQVAASPRPVPAAAPHARPPRGDLVYVPIDRIDAGHNIRTDHGEAGMPLLQQSIEAVGLLEPVIVRKAGKRFEMVAGHRRLEASRRSGAELIEAKVYDDGADDRWVAEARLAENVQRKDLNHIELAAELGRAAQAGMTVREIVVKTKLGDDAVRRHLALLRLCPPVAELVAAGRLPLHQAELIAHVGDVARQIQLAGECLAIRWDAKAGTWDSKPGWGHKDGDPTDFIMPMENLRGRVASAMCGLAGCGWLRAEEKEATRRRGDAETRGAEGEEPETPISDDGGIAGQRSCAGCPSNTCSYADQPTLFAGVHPAGSDKRGFCSSRPCYEAKEAVWGKVVDRRKAAEGEQRQKKADQARKAGLDVCEGFPPGQCGRVADAGEEFPACEQASGAKLCATCTEKAKKAAARGGGGGGRREAERVFPSTGPERLAVAIAAHAGIVLAAIRAWAAEQDGASLPDGPYVTVLADLVALRVAWGRAENRSAHAVWMEMTLPIQPFAPTAEMAEQMADGGCGELHGLLEALARMEFEAQPRYQSWEDKAANVPIPDGDMEFLGLAETFCQARGIPIPGRPTARDAETAELRERILTAGKDDLAGVLAKVGREDVDVLEAILKDAEAADGKAGIKKLAKWRDKAIVGRLGELRGFIGDPRAVGRALAGGKAAGKKAAAACRDRIAGRTVNGAVTPQRVEGDPFVRMEAAILSGKKAEALAAIEQCTQLEWLTAIDKQGLSGDWRRAAVAGRIGHLRDLAARAGVENELAKADGLEPDDGGPADDGGGEDA